MKSQQVMLAVFYLIGPFPSCRLLFGLMVMEEMTRLGKQSLHVFYSQ